MVAISCPNCGQIEPVTRFGFNRGGTARLRCKACSKTWTPQPNQRSLSPDKQEQILAALAERMSLRAIARTFGVGRVTVTALLKKSG